MSSVVSEKACAWERCLATRVGSPLIFVCDIFLDTHARTPNSANEHSWREMEAALSQLGGERVTLRRQCTQHAAAPEIVKNAYMHMQFILVVGNGRRARDIRTECTHWGFGAWCMHSPAVDLICLLDSRAHTVERLIRGAVCSLNALKTCFPLLLASLS